MENNVKAVFDLFDTDKDGKIPPTELGPLIRALGTYAQLIFFIFLVCAFGFN